MKQLLYALLLGFLLSGCLEETCQDTVTFQSFVPIYVTPGEWRTADLSFTPAEDICEPSGFYIYQDILFVADKGRGMHIIDNSDNGNPITLNFLNIPGGTGLSARNGILYVNQYTDLLAFDIRNPRKPELLSRTEDVFSPYSVFGGGISAEGSYIAGYEAGTEIRKVDCNSPNFGNQWFRQGGEIFVDVAQFDGAIQNFNLASEAFGGSGEVVGTGGSLARFTITNGNLYAVDDNSLRAFSLDDPVNPEFIAESNLGWGIETVFPQGNLLYIGSTTGMHIFDVSSPAAPPTHLSTFEHVLSCDPVVVQGDLAYVTMWGGSTCGSAGDQLMVIDVSDPSFPSLLQEVPMSQSHGLGIDGDKLFLCSGTEGLRVFDLDDRGLLGDEIGRETSFNAKDVIVLPGKKELIVFGWEVAGIKQYDYKNDGSMTPVSELTFCD